MYHTFLNANFNEQNLVTFGISEKSAKILIDHFTYTLSYTITTLYNLILIKNKMDSHSEVNEQKDKLVDTIIMN